MKTGRNDPCPCGSERKFKKCCAAKFETRLTVQNASLKGAAPTSAECNQLAALFNTGLYTELESQSRVLVEQYPESGFAWKALGTSLQVQGKEALSAMQKATEFLPNDAETHSNFGKALKDLGRLDAAAASFRRALQIKPDYVEAHYSLGVILQALGQLDAAVASYRRVLEIKPDFIEVYINLGVTLQNLGQPDAAAASCRRALEIEPDFAEAHYNLGVILQDIGQLDAAVDSYRLALQIKPDMAEAHCNLGATLQGLGHPSAAAESYRRALEIKPDDVEAHSNLGATLQDLGQLDAAVESYRRALQIKPDCVKAYSNLGVTLQDLGQPDAAAASCRRALEIEPDFAEAHYNMGVILQDIGQLDAAVGSYQRALEIKPDFTKARSNLLFIHNYSSCQTAVTLLAEARQFGDLVARQAHSHTNWHNVPEADRCLRVGLVSGDLRNHPVGYFVEGMLEVLASNASGRLEFIAYPSYSLSDSLTERIKASCLGWHSAVGLSDERLAKRIRDDAIDILIDLSGHTAHNRLPMFAWKPAPVQASWLGYFATTGVAAMDYLIADPWTIPEAEEANFSEKIWRLPETYLCFTPPDMEVQVSSLPALTEGHLTFGCFNKLTKMNDSVVALWARVLLAVPESRLFLKTMQLGESAVRQSVVNRFAAQGIDAERLMLEEAAPRADLLASYNRVDIALDPFPYPGGTTSVEALWMGVPVLTLAGDRFLSHIGESIQQNIGLPEWICADADDYVARAVSHASDQQRLAELRNGLRKQVLASPMFDTQRFAHHFEAALRGLWKNWCNQQ